MITIKSQEAIEQLIIGGKILGNILHKLSAMVKPGVSTGELEEAACRLIKEAGGRPAFKNYRGSKKEKAFPTALCTSINNEVVHAPAFPSRILENGDIIGIDVGMEYPCGLNQKGYYTDTAMTVAVGNISLDARRLINVTKEALNRAIEQAKPRKTLWDIGAAVQSHVETNGFSVVRSLVGHGVGYAVHEDPQIPNYIAPGIETKKIILKPGMVIAIEPMVNMGGSEVDFGARDDFSITTHDHSLSAHFEHTIIITEEGNIVATQGD